MNTAHVVRILNSIRLRTCAGIAGNQEVHVFQIHEQQLEQEYLIAGEGDSIEEAATEIERIDLEYPSAGRLGEAAAANLEATGDRSLSAIK
jgi:hypothetical protein